MLVLVLCFWGRFRDSVAVSKDVTKVPKFLAENFSPCHGPGSISESWRDHVVIVENWCSSSLSPHPKVGMKFRRSDNCCKHSLVRSLTLILRHSKHSRQLLHCW
jgi:hypothetical protein